MEVEKEQSALTLKPGKRIQKGSVTKESFTLKPSEHTMQDAELVHQDEPEITSGSTTTIRRKVTKGQKVEEEKKVNPFGLKPIKHRSSVKEDSQSFKLKPISKDTVDSDGGNTPTRLSRRGSRNTVEADQGVSMKLRPTRKSTKEEKSEFGITLKPTSRKNPGK
jgi:hypothetical protein